MPDVEPTTPAPQKRKRKKAAKNADLSRLYAYVKGIIDGDISTSKYTVLAAKRFVADLERQKDTSFPYIFDEEKAARAFRFFALLTNVRGDITGQPLVVHEWGLFFLGQLFGWVTKTTETRRFRKAMAWTPRGNCKSTYLAAAMSYAAFAEGGQADVYALGVKREQAQIVWKDGADMLRASPKLMEQLGLEVRAHEVIRKATNSVFKPLASESKSLDGLTVAAACIDELHVIPRELAEVIDTALGKRANSVRVSISTAGMDSESYGHDEYMYCRAILDGQVKDEMTLAIIYEMPEGADPHSTAAQIAANPMYGISVRPEILAQASAKAKRDFRSKASYMVKHLNVWMDATAQWMDMDRFDACMDPTLRREDFVGQQVIVGVDLAQRIDLCAKVLVFPRTKDDGSREYVVFSDTYLNEEAVRDSKNDAYRAWANDGFIKTNPGDVTEIHNVTRDIEQDASTFVVTEVAFDPYFAAVMEQDLGSKGIPTTRIDQRVALLSPAMKEVEAAVFQKRLRWAPNPTLRYCVANVVARVDANDNVFPRRESSSRPPIDAASALLNAIARAAVVDVATSGGPSFLESYEDYE